MIRAVFGSNNNTCRNWNLTLTSPSNVLIAHKPAEVIDLVNVAEQASLSGSYVAMMLTYEAASAFDDALITHSPMTSLPLTWAAIFPEATKDNESPLNI